jgi:hypothetical protein
MKPLSLKKIYITLAILLILFLTFFISCTNVRNNQFTIGKQLEDSNTTIETTETSKETNITNTWQDDVQKALNGIK